MGSKRIIQILDATLRDGSHPLRHQYDTDTLSRIASYLERANVPYLEVCHGDGLGGSSLHFGKSRLTDEEAISSVKAAAQQVNIAALLLPGVGRLTDLEQAVQMGISTVRIATLASEADLAHRYIKRAADLGIEAFGFLMLSSTCSPEQLLEQARMLEAFGANVIYIVDSAGAMTIDEVRFKVSLLRHHLSVRIGFHGHNNLGLAVGNTLVAVEEGADLVDGCLAGFGAGAGNAPTEVLAAALHKMGYDTGTNAGILLQAADDMMKQVMPAPQFIERGALALGTLGIRGSSLFTSLPLLGKYGIDVRDILSQLVTEGSDARSIEALADIYLIKQSNGEPGVRSRETKGSGPHFH
ncbi:4-hydroxy-2-oxovalerate aldolase [Paenibacillus sp. FSL H8-0034]|uniref:4-hydroxy-2-oxovalerate aldolase n=1 Tax=Paenibacillus sp. FSL H8-0034 TaxID=2954671 RepID=UPI0030F8C8CD